MDAIKSNLNYIPIIKYMFQVLKDVNKIITFTNNEISIMTYNKDIQNFVMTNPISEFEHYQNSDEKFDIVLVDNDDIENRWKWINASFNKTSCILVHDTDSLECDWKKVILPSDFKWIDLDLNEPWTSIISNNSFVIDHFTNVLKMNLRE